MLTLIPNLNVNNEMKNIVVSILIYNTRFYQMKVSEGAGDLCDDKSVEIMCNCTYNQI